MAGSPSASQGTGRKAGRHGERRGHRQAGTSAGADLPAGMPIRSAHVGHHGRRPGVRRAFRPAPDLPRAPRSVEYRWRAVRTTESLARDLAGLGRREDDLHRYEVRRRWRPGRRQSRLRQRPHLFSWAVRPPPPSYGQGTWEIGVSSRRMMGLQNQPEAGVITIQFGSGILGTYPLVGLEVEGLTSAPSFLCEYPDPTNAVTFRKIPAYAAREVTWQTSQRNQHPENGDNENKTLPISAQEQPIWRPVHETPKLALMPRGVRAAQVRGKITSAGMAS